MKDIGKIRFKDLFKVVSKKNKDRNVLLLAATQDRGIIPKNEVGYKTVTISDDNYEGLKLVQKGDFCITLRSFQGGIEYSEYDGGISSGYTVLRLKKRSSERYFKYFLKNIHFIATLNKYKISIRDGQNIPFSDLGKESILFLDYDKQMSISNYLDFNVIKIDKEIEFLYKKSILLDEYKNALIYETVTKGLDKNAEMKDSGVDSIGDIPKNWTVNRLKDKLNIQKGSVFTDDLSDDEGVYPYINGGVKPSGWTNAFNCMEKTIAVSEGGASSGYSQYMETKFWAGSHCYKITPRRNDNSKYYYYLLKGFEKEIQSAKTGSAMPNLQKSKFTNLIFSFTSDLVEQNSIVEYLDLKTQKIEKQIELINKKVELLKEYKQSLIYEAVTGQLEIE